MGLQIDGTIEVRFEWIGLELVSNKMEIVLKKWGVDCDGNRQVETKCLKHFSNGRETVCCRVMFFSVFGDYFVY